MHVFFKLFSILYLYLYFKISYDDIIVCHHQTTRLFYNAIYNYILFSLISLAKQTPMSNTLREKPKKKQ